MPHTHQQNILEIFTSKSAIARYLIPSKKENKTIGFVPTMWALHKGHLSLIDIAGELTDTVVCSIFVNPTQFTDPKDLKKYPRPIEADIELLRSSRCRALFLPSVEEMYSANETWSIDLGGLDNILEGTLRPGHYQGVTQIVKKLLDVVNPDFMFMGQKDYQQVMVLEHMVKTLNIPVELVMCPIVREPSGLALSSRNVHLSDTEHSQAAVLSKVLQDVKARFADEPIESLKEGALQALRNAAGIEPEYFEICNARTLQPATEKDRESVVALVAAKVGNTRLIDNIILK